MRKLKAVCFDLDGVITDTSEYHYLAWKKLATRIGIEIDRKFNEELKGLSRADSLRKILNHAGQLTDCSEKVFQKLTEEKNENFRKMIKNISEKNIFPGILSLLEELKNCQIKVALTSASLNAQIILERLKVIEYFTTIVEPRLIQHGKPAPDIYLAAAASVGEAPENCLGIEDAASGIAAIQAAGMTPVGVGAREYFGRGVAVVSTTEDLTLKYLEKIFEEVRRK